MYVQMLQGIKSGNMDRGDQAKRNPAELTARLITARRLAFPGLSRLMRDVPMSLAWSIANDFHVLTHVLTRKRRDRHLCARARAVPA